MGIKSLELEPSKENLLSTLTSNLIGRNKSVWYFARFCNLQEGKSSIAVDGKWGYGKTFFVKQTKMLIEAFNIFTKSLTEEERETVKSAFAREIGRGETAVELLPQVCVYYDAWANDNDADPILSLVYEIIKSTAVDYTFRKGVDCVKAAALIADFFKGKNASDLITLARETDPLAELKGQKEIQSLVEEFLDSLLFEQGDRLVVFIDELDRCKPSYAVQLLERIKHYFSNDRITFVFSVNIDELQHTIKRYYGDGFDACRYLDRFFDYRISLPPADMTLYYRELGLDTQYVYESVCREVIKKFSFGLREAEKYYRNAKIAAYSWTHADVYYGFSDRKGLQFALCTILPIALGLKMVNTNLYNEFIEGKNSKPLLDILGEGDIAGGLCGSLLRNTETYLEGQPNKTFVTRADKLNEVYCAIFAGKEARAWEEISIGECVFSKETKDAILRAESLLSEFATYE